MISMFSRSGLLAASLGLAALAGCNAAEDVRSEPTIVTPPAKVVLQGTVTGIGSKRSLGLMNNGDSSDSLSVVAPTPENAYVNDTFAVPFNFGSRAVTDANGNPTPYNIEITTQPYGKICSFRAGTVRSGILSTEAPPDIVIDCIPDPAVPRYNLDVILDPAFANAPGAKVLLRTEDAIYEQEVTAAHIAAGRMTFAGRLFNGAGAGSPANSPVFTWTVSATTTVGGTVNRCPVLRPTNSPATQNPTAHITAAGVAPQVLPCSFTISGAAYYSRPVSATADSPLGAGLTLELRNQSGVRKGTATVAAGAFPATGIAFTFTNTDTPATTAFTSNPDADFQVVVATHPAGQTCIVPDGGYVSLRSLINLNPVSVTATGTLPNGNTPAAGPAANPAANTFLAGQATASLNSPNSPAAGTRLIVFCRNKPAPADQLHGVYRLTKTVAQITSRTDTRTGASTVVAGPLVNNTVTQEWKPFDFTVQNTASNNIITFFDDGTFLYGTHHSTNQLEHGFYEYSATLKADNGASSATPNGRLRLTMHTDTFPNTTFPGTFSSADQAPAANPAFSATPGISALPGALVYSPAPNAPLPARHANLGGVVKTAAAGSAPARITGTSGPYGGNVNSTTAVITPTTIADPVPAAPGTAIGATSTLGVAKRVEWELTEVSSVNGEFTGGWISQDHRRFWVWDKASTYGFHVGVNGLPNLQSSCFVTENAVSPSGTYQRRSAQTLCFPINRPREGQNYNGTTDARDAGWLTVTHVFTPTLTTITVGSPTAAQNAVNTQGEYSTGGLTSRFPNYESRIPGGFTVLDGRAPSPIYYHIAPAASFTTSAPAEYFPEPSTPFTTWCSTEILGIRGTLNNVPFKEPVYLCRTRAQ